MVSARLRGGLRRSVQVLDTYSPYSGAARPLLLQHTRLFSSSSTNSTSVKPPRYGQPLSSTHPHLVKEGNLTIGIPASEYEARRKRLMKSLPEGSVVICMGGTVRYMSEHIFYKFRQATDFFYLTGYNEPDATLVLESKPSTSRGYKYTVFVPTSDPKKDQWDGATSGLDGATSIFGADQAYPNSLLPQYLPSYLRSSDIYASLPPSPSPSPSSQPFSPPSARKRSSLLKLFSSSSSASYDPTPGSAPDPPHLLLAAAISSDKAKPLSKEMHKIRSIKSENEIRLMKRAADLSSGAHTKAMRETKPGMSEGQVQAVFEYHTAMGGSERPAYVPVVASGANGLVIHYTRNECLIEDGDLVLIDAGCELGMYASDITRTYPANGRFTDPQRDLYEAVLSAQKGVLKECIEGNNLQELQQIACRLLEENLRQIGFKLSTGDVNRKGLYPHYISHHLGSDLHDCASHDRNAKLENGNVITIEPGLYIPSSPDFPKHFHGMGIRIEDEVALTKNGLMVLSANAPKEVSDVEGACQGILDRS